MRCAGASTVCFRRSNSYAYNAARGSNGRLIAFTDTLDLIKPTLRTKGDDNGNGTLRHRWSVRPDRKPAQ